MRLAIAAIITALYVHAISAGPLSGQPVNLDLSAYPATELAIAKATANVTLGAGGVLPDAAQQEFPATLVFCSSGTCMDCFQQVDLATVPAGVCLATGGPTNSVIILQPSGDGLPFNVYVGEPDCSPSYGIPQVNMCYYTTDLPLTTFWRN
ncbi:hypothetical protein FKP32DRAFT_1593456 [Trametes sanguinea]|nr:hypothetical protein FKP32DRAFT_1593456 [Trametes sanguinea]